MSKNNFSEYLRTVTFTIIVLVITTSIMAWKAKFASEHNPLEDESAIQNDMIGYLIEKYRYYETQDPRNPQITLEIAMLYDMFGSFSQAETEYLKAYEKTDYKSDAILFKLAGLYLSAKKYDEALRVVSEIPDSPKYSNILEKGLFYKDYADILLIKKDYENAIKYYEKAEFYLDKIEYRDKRSILSQKCIAYTDLADVYVLQNRATEAIEVLTKALKIDKNPIIYYKLAILNIERDPLLSVKYFELVNRKDPSLINYNLYKQVLLNLRLRYFELKDVVSADLYKTKFDRLNFQIQSNYLNPNEIALTDVNVKINNSIIFDKSTIILSFSLKNSTGIPIDKLTAIAEFTDAGNSPLVSAEYQIVTTDNRLEPDAPPQKYQIKLKTRKSVLKHNKTINLDLYFTKNKKYITQLLLKKSINIQ